MIMSLYLMVGEEFKEIFNKNCFFITINLTQIVHQHSSVTKIEGHELAVPVITSTTAVGGTVLGCYQEVALHPGSSCTAGITTTNGD